MEHLICVSTLIVLCQASYQPSGHPQTSGYPQTQADKHHKDSSITLCPDNDLVFYNDCVSLDQLLSHNLIKSNTIFKFVPDFEMKPNNVAVFENVSNITFDTAGSQRASIYCSGENSGFFFRYVSGLVIQNIRFIKCGAIVVVEDTRNSTLSLFESSEIELENVTFEYGQSGGYGVLGVSVYGNISILNTDFKYLQGPALRLYNYNSCEPNYQNCQGNITITNSRFDSGYITKSDNTFSYAIDILVGLDEFPVRIYITNITVTNNTHNMKASGILIEALNSQPNVIILKSCNYNSNHVLSDVTDVKSLSNLISSDFYYSSNDISYEAVVEIVDSQFINNDFGGNKITDLNKIGFEYMIFYFYNNAISIRNTTISNNSGHYDSIIYSSCVNNSFTMTDLKIDNNRIFPSIYNYYKKGTVHLSRARNITVHNCHFTDNSATGLLIEDSHAVYFSGMNTFRGNKGYNGGGMAAYGEYFIYLVGSVKTVFEGNVAENVGGGWYHDQCFHLYAWHQTNNTPSLQFANNSAKIAGNDFYGGNMYTCEVWHEYYWQKMTDIIHSPDTMDLTSDPLHVCDCSTESSQDCINVVRTIQTVKTYPGKLFNLSLVSVGNLLNSTTMSGVPTAVYANLLPLHPNPGTIPGLMRVQNGKRHCSMLEYRVNSSNQNEVMVLAIDDNLNKVPEYFLMLLQLNDSQWDEQVNRLFLEKLTVPAYVNIELLSCPVGFELSNGECKCSTPLLNFVISCSIDTLLIKRKPSVWLSAFNVFAERGNISSTLYRTHKHCPFDYCNSSNDFEFSLEQPDTQCNHKRSGILCGECVSGYSLVLGRMACRQCTNIYLLLIIPFGLAGILLILFLSLTDLTVSAGTINGLLFFANIVQENKTTFFPPQAAKGFLSVFIAWLNLDLGIETCFYDGLDSYAFTWLQLAFPIYMWFLAFSIIIASRHFTLLNKVCGRNIVQVLATLFLLSYTKLQRTIVTSLSFTAIYVSDGTKEYVWLMDGNVLYLHGKHIPLFLVNFLCLLILFVPYTLSIMLGPWLQSKTQHRVFFWVVKLKPLFDAYFGPLKDKHRHWTGVLLFSRVILSLVSAANVQGNDSINLLSIIILTFILLVALLWKSGGAYKVWALSFLDTFFLINLGLLASTTFYNRVSGGSQYATVYIATGSTFTVFSIILLYHFLKKINPDKCRFFRSNLSVRSSYYRPLLEGDDSLESDNNENSDNEMLNVIDEGRISDHDPRLSFCSTDFNTSTISY